MEIELEQQPKKPNPTQEVPVYMITVPTSFESKYYSKEAGWSWANRGYTLNYVPALKAEDPYYKTYESRFTEVERTFGKKGRRTFYKTEISRFLSHVKLWEAIVSRGIRHSFIVEHDCKLVRHVPPIIYNTDIAFIARSSEPSFYTNYTERGIKSCAGYHLRLNFAETLLEDFYSTPVINFNIEKYLYIMSIFHMKYSATGFIKTRGLPAIEMYDTIIGNTVKDERKIY